MKLSQSILVILMLFMLSGCSIFSPVKPDTSAKYLLSSVPVYFPKHTAHRGTILVMLPDTRPIYNTTQMAYSSKLYEVSYYAQNEWAETPSQMLQPLLAQTLQNTHVYRAVVEAPFAGQYDYMLTTDILTLQQNFTHPPSQVQFFVRVQLTSASTARIIASKEFYIYEPIWVRTPYGGVIAANQATAKLLRKIAEFCVQNT